MPNAIGTRFYRVGRAWKDTTDGCQRRLFLFLYLNQILNGPLTFPSSSANMSHVSPLLACGSGGRPWKPEPTTMPHFEISAHGSEKLVQHSNIWHALPLLADNNQMVLWKEWNEFQQNHGFSVSGAESCWVQAKARRAWQLLVILARGRWRTHASLLRQSQPTCGTAPSRPRPWESRSCVRTDSSRNRQFDHPTKHVSEEIIWLISAQFSCPPVGTPLSVPGGVQHSSLRLKAPLWDAAGCRRLKSDINWMPTSCGCSPTTLVLRQSDRSPVVKKRRKACHKPWTVVLSHGLRGPLDVVVWLAHRW